MVKDSRLHLEVVDGHLRLVPQGNLTDRRISQILRAAEVGLQVFSLVVVDLQESRGSEEGALTLLEEGLQQIIAKRKQAILKAQGTESGNHGSLLPKPAMDPAKDKAPRNRPQPVENLDDRPVRLIWSRRGVSP